MRRENACIQTGGLAELMGICREAFLGGVRRHLHNTKVVRVGGESSPSCSSGRRELLLERRPCCSESGIRAATLSTKTKQKKVASVVRRCYLPLLPG